MAKLDRRDFLKMVSAGVAAVSAGRFFPRCFIADAMAQGQPSNGQAVIEIFLSGGSDWFLTHRPGDGAFLDTLRNIRPTLYSPPMTGFPNGSRRPLGSSNHTLHHQLRYFSSLFDQGRLCVIQGAGIPRNNSGSHEEATLDVLTGTDDGRRADRMGWMQKTAQVYFTDPFNVIDLNGGSDATSGGTFRPLAVRNFAQAGLDANAAGGNSFRFNTAMAVVNQARGNLEQIAYQQSWSQVEQTVTRVAAANSSSSNVMSPAFPNSGLGRQLRDALIAIKDFGSSMVFTTTGGFDLHAMADPANQPAGNDGDTVMPNGMTGQSALLWNLNRCLQVLDENLIRLNMRDRVTVVITSEFARTNRENGNIGVDHGDAGVSFVIGSGFRGGIYGQTPTAQDLLRPQNSVDATTAYTDIYCDVLQKMGLNPAQVFPGYVRKPTGILI